MQLGQLLHAAGVPAAHVVADACADVDPWVGCAIDWDATIAYRRHLSSWGFGIAEAMAIQELLDAQPLFAAPHAAFLERAARYYAYPLGEAVRTALPAGLGMHRVNWDLRYDAPPAFTHSFEINANPGLTPASPEGGLAAPGTYRAATGCPTPRAFAATSTRCTPPDSRAGVSRGISSRSAIFMDSCSAKV